MTGSEFQTLDAGRLRAAAGEVALLRANGLETFEGVMACAGGKVMRSVPGRSTVRLELPRPGGGVTVVFLKRYRREYLTFTNRWLRRLGWPPAQDEAAIEWRAIQQLHSAGFNTAALVAIGQGLEGGVVTRSFLMTAEITGGIAGHNYVSRLDADGRRDLIPELAELTRRFHGAGFAHRDLYLSHVFVVPSPVGPPVLSLIDLQRLFRPRLLKQRWLVKDLAALGYSAQINGATRSDLLRFYQALFRTTRLERTDRKLIRRIAARIQSLHRRGPKHDVIWDQPGVRPSNV